MILLSPQKIYALSSQIFLQHWNWNYKIILQQLIIIYPLNLVVYTNENAKEKPSSLYKVRVQISAEPVFTNNLTSTQKAGKALFRWNRTFSTQFFI